MITVVKGSSKIKVTKETFEEQLKPLGYQIASENKGAAKKVAPLLENKEEEDNLKESLLENKEEEDLSKKWLKEDKTSTSKKGK